jgi:serine/threonine protein kinase
VRAEFGVSGTLPYMAGELLSKNSSGGLTERPRLDQHVEDHQAVDVWAAACTAYAILTGLDLFSYDLSQPEAEQKADIYKQQAALVSVLVYKVFLLKGFSWASRAADGMTCSSGAAVLATSAFSIAYEPCSKGCVLQSFELHAH